MGRVSSRHDQGSEEDYDEGGFDDVAEDGKGMDEMEKLRAAMANQKLKAPKFNNKV